MMPFYCGQVRNLHCENKQMLIQCKQSKWCMYCSKPQWYNLVTPDELCVIIMWMCSCTVFKPCPWGLKYSKYSFKHWNNLIFVVDSHSMRLRFTGKIMTSNSFKIVYKITPRILYKFIVINKTKVISIKNITSFSLSCTAKPNFSFYHNLKMGRSSFTKTKIM